MIICVKTTEKREIIAHIYFESGQWNQLTNYLSGLRAGHPPKATAINSGAWSFWPLGKYAATINKNNDNIIASILTQATKHKWDTPH